MSLAGLATGFAAAAILIWRFAEDGKARLRMLGLFALGFLAPPAAAFLLLSTAMPPSGVFFLALDPLRPLSYPSVAAMPFYQTSLGLDHPARNLIAMFRWAGGYLGAAAWLGLWTWLAKTQPRRFFIPGLVMALIPAGLLILFREQIAMVFFAAPFGLLLAGGLVWGAFAWLGSRDDAAREGVIAARIVLVIMALSLLPKMLLWQRTFQYGFCLGLPAAMAVFSALMHWLPQWMAKNGRAALVFKAGVLALAVWTAAVHIQWTNGTISSRVHPMGEGRDFLVWDARASVFNAVLEMVERFVPEGKTMAVLPACVMFNYMGRVRNSTPYIMCIPPEMEMFGEEDIASAYQSSPPDYILLVHQDNAKYGARFFGKDYGRDFYAWIMKNYEETAGMGERPFENKNGGIMLLKSTVAPSPAG